MSDDTKMVVGGIAFGNPTSEEMEAFRRAQQGRALADLMPSPAPTDETLRSLRADLARLRAGIEELARWVEGDEWLVGRLRALLDAGKGEP